MKRISLAILGLSFLISIHAQTYDLPRSTPEAEGVESKLIMDYFENLMNLPKTEIHSVMVLRHGKVIAEIYPEPFAPEYRHTVFSASKTFTAIAVGIAIDENRLRVTDRVASYLIEHLPEEISDNLARMTVHDLLIMSSGIVPETNMRDHETEWLKTYFAKEVLLPGEKFRYDSIPTYMLSAIVQKVTGMTCFEYLKTKMFEPMNITDIGWEISPEGITVGGWGLHVQSEALAKMGQLLLNKGVWNGKRIVSAEWTEEMMKSHIDTGFCGYGYQMWVQGPEGTARADGAYGQFSVVVPSKDMVLVVTEFSMAEGNPQTNSMWRMIPQINDEILVPGKDYKLLCKKMEEYSLPKMEGKASSSLSKVYNGRTFKLEENYLGWESISFNFGKNLVTAHITEKDGKEYDIAFGHKTWEKSTINTYPPYPLIQAMDRFKGIDCPFLAAGNYAWASKDSMKMKIYYVNWISSLELDVRFEDEGISLTITRYFDQHTTVKGR